MKRRKRRLRLLFVTAIAVEPPQRVVVSLVELGVCERGCRVLAHVRARVSVEMGAARRAAAVVLDLVFRAGISLARVGCSAVRRFARFRTDETKLGVDSLVIGGGTLGSGWV